MDNNEQVCRELKRMKIDTTGRISKDNRKRICRAPVILNDSPMEELKSPAKRKAQMIALLHEQMGTFKSQYATITQGLDIAPCDM